MAKVLMIHPDKCTGCRNCELACSFEHERSVPARRVTGDRCSRGSARASPSP